MEILPSTLRIIHHGLCDSAATRDGLLGQKMQTI
jgi:hypothetical protein